MELVYAACAYNPRHFNCVPRLLRIHCWYLDNENRKLVIKITNVAHFHHKSFCYQAFLILYILTIIAFIAGTIAYKYDETFVMLKTFLGERVVPKNFLASIYVFTQVCLMAPSV